MLRKRGNNYTLGDKGKAEMFTLPSGTINTAPISYNDVD